MEDYYCKVCSSPNHDESAHEVGEPEFNRLTEEQMNVMERNQMVKTFHSALKAAYREIDALEADLKFRRG